MARQHKTPGDEEREQRMEDMETRGVKGCKLPRINTAFSSSNYDFIKTMSRINGVPMTQYVNQIIEEYRKDNGEYYEAAKALIAKAEAGAAKKGGGDES